MDPKMNIILIINLHFSKPEKKNIRTHFKLQLRDYFFSQTYRNLLQYFINFIKFKLHL